MYGYGRVIAPAGTVLSLFGVKAGVLRLKEKE